MSTGSRGNCFTGGAPGPGLDNVGYAQWSRRYLNAKWRQIGLAHVVGPQHCVWRPCRRRLDICPLFRTSAPSENYFIHKSLFTEKRQQHKNTHKHKSITKTEATTKSIKSNDTLHWSISINYYIFIFIHQAVTGNYYKHYISYYNLL